MRLARITMLVLAFIALSAFADDAKHAQDRKECGAQGDAAVAKAVVKSPIGVIKVKNDEIARCMRLRGYATGPIRAK